MGRLTHSREEHKVDDMADESNNIVFYFEAALKSEACLRSRLPRCSAASFLLGG